MLAHSVAWIKNEPSDIVILMWDMCRNLVLGGGPPRYMYKIWAHTSMITSLQDYKLLYAYAYILVYNTKNMNDGTKFISLIHTNKNQAESCSPIHWNITTLVLWVPRRGWKAIYPRLHKPTAPSHSLQQYQIPNPPYILHTTTNNSRSPHV